MPTELQRRLGLLDALAILVGVTIGGGIFLVPNMVAQNLTSQPAILGIWAFAGLISFFGVLACADAAGLLSPSRERRRCRGWHRAGGRPLRARYPA